MAETGAPGRAGPTILREALVLEPLWELPLFPTVLPAFCLVRLLRPLLLSTDFAEGPQTRDWTTAENTGLAVHSQNSAPRELDGAVRLALGLGCASAGAGLAAALLLQRWLRRCAARRGLPPCERPALYLLCAAAGLELLHHAVAVAKYEFFFGTAMVPAGQVVEPPVYLLVLLHVSGLLGTGLLFLTYLRFFLASWHLLAENPTAGREQALRAAAVRISPTRRGEQQAQSSKKGRTKRGNDSWSEDSDSDVEAQRFSDVTKAMAQAAAAAFARSDAEERPSPSTGAGSGSTSPGQVWFWWEGAWRPARLLRASTGDAEKTYAVRLPGGAVVTGKRSHIRPRQPGADEPTQPPSSPGSAPRGASADPGRPEPAGPPPRAAEARSPRARSAPPRSGRESARKEPTAQEHARPAPAPPTPLTQEQQWASDRMAKLRRELQDLERLEPSERRRGLRALQRELHPDKLPQELRSHAQPLFHLVQKEWELCDAAKEAPAH